MSLFSSRVVGAATLLLAAQASATTYLSPEQDINLPSSESATEPLEWLGANSPYFAGPNVNNISSTVPDGCVIDQVAYVVRHGSRYPDSGAYAQWVALYQKIGNASFVAQGSLEFLKDWQPVLTNPTAQMSQESSTGYKEAYDLGYQLRTRYPQLYSYGSPFMSWANLYPRVVQTAQNFVRGFLGSAADSLGTVITVNSTGSPDAFFDSLSPSDLCPAFVDGNGGTEATIWAATYLPPITARLNSLLTGNLTFVDSDVSIFPYLCGFESQITGTLSPWCGVFTDDELLQYEYAQDLRYYYGTGPGTGLPSQMMLPFLNSLVGLLEDGPGQNGTFANGTSYTLPSILTAFLNDGQITELGAATGVWDDQTALSGTAIPDDWKYIASHFVTMRGTVAFERMTCATSPTIAKRSYPEKNEPVTVTVDHTVTEHDCAPPATPTSYTTSTVYKSSIFTSKGHLTTRTVADYTTTCPVSATSAPSPAKVTTVVGGKTSIVGGKTTTIRGMTSIVGGQTTIRSGSTSVIGGYTSISGASTTIIGGTSTIIGGTTIVSTPSSTSTAVSTTSASSSAAYTSIPTYSNTTNPTSTSAIYSNTTSTGTLPTTTSSTNSSSTYIRIRLNDAVYPLPACQSGPGSSCLLSTYVDLISAKIEAAGSLYDNCNVTNTAIPSDGVKGASFFTDAGSSWLAEVAP